MTAILYTRPPSIFDVFFGAPAPVPAIFRGFTLNGHAKIECQVSPRSILGLARRADDNEPIWVHREVSPGGIVFVGCPWSMDPCAECGAPLVVDGVWRVPMLFVVRSRSGAPVCCSTACVSSSKRRATVSPDHARAVTNLLIADPYLVRTFDEAVAMILTGGVNV
jgi:hypothetical protein